MSTDTHKILPFDFNLTARKLETTLPMILPEVQDNCTRNYQMLALISQRGNVRFNDGGLGINWKVKHRNHKVQGTNGESPRNWTQMNPYRTARLDWRGYEVTDTISGREVKQNKGEAAIINIFEEFENNLKKSIEQELGPQFYNDGYDASHPNYWHGFLSMFRQNGQTLNGDGSGARAKNAADKVVYAEGNFAELDTELGAYSGNQHDTSVPWPQGTADAHYDFWTPLILQWDGSTAFAGDTNGEKLKNAIRYGVTHSQRNVDRTGPLTHFWLDRTNYIAFKDFYETKQTIEVTSGTELYSLGFKNVILFDGVEVSFENAVPSGFGFGVNMDQMEIRCLDDMLFSMDGPEWDIDLKLFKAAVSTESNLLCRSPRNTVILAPAAKVV